MNGTGSTSIAVVVGPVRELECWANRPPFTPVQWQELEHQAMIYKYLVAGLPVPPDLVMPIRRGFEAISARFFLHPSLSYYSHNGKKFDPEPGRCRRTDGKKWRCSKCAHPDSKYCERHMHRGRNRSRKPVEAQPTSQPLLAGISHIATGCSNDRGFLGNDSNGNFQSMPLYSVASAEGLSFRNDVMQLKSVIYGVDNKEFSFPQNALLSGGSNIGLGTSTGAGSATVYRMPPQVLLGAQQNVFEPLDVTTISKPDQRQPVHPFFREWASTKESWSNLDDDDASNTQLSISIPQASSEFPPRSDYSLNDA